MSKAPIPKISPLIERWHPKASQSDKMLYTDELRAFLAACFELCDREPDKDSRDSGTHARVESDNPPTP